MKRAVAELIAIVELPDVRLFLTTMEVIDNHVRNVVNRNTSFMGTIDQFSFFRCLKGRTRPKTLVEAADFVDNFLWYRQIATVDETARMNYPAIDLRLV